MKTKLILGTIAAIFVLVIIMVKATGNSYSWSFFSSKIAAKETLKSDIYNVSMLGNDGRAYSFKFKDRNCLAVATTEGVGLDCWK